MQCLISKSLTLVTVCNFPGIDFPGNRFDAVRIAFLWIRGMLLAIAPFPDELTIFEPATGEREGNELWLLCLLDIKLFASSWRNWSATIKSICDCRGRVQSIESTADGERVAPKEKESTMGQWTQSDLVLIDALIGTDKLRSWLVYTNWRVLFIEEDFCSRTLA